MAGGSVITSIKRAMPMTGGSISKIVKIGFKRKNLTFFKKEFDPMAGVFWREAVFISSSGPALTPLAATSPLTFVSVFSSGKEKIPGLEGSSSPLSKLANLSRISEPCFLCIILSLSSLLLPSASVPRCFLIFLIYLSCHAKIFKTI